MRTFPDNVADSLCYLNGDYGPLSEARVSVLDRGFIFGDGIYDVAPVYGRRLFRFDEHMARLDRGLAKIRIANPLARNEWLERCRRIVAAHPADDQLVYIEVTRGVAARDHVMPPDIEPTVFIMASAMKPPTAEQRHQGVACVTARDFRWERGDIKSVSLLGNVLARQMSADHGALETVMFRDGFLTEASGSNVWVVQEGALLGSPSTCWKASASSCCASCARRKASPTTCVRSRRPTCSPPTRCCSLRRRRRCCR